MGQRAATGGKVVTSGPTYGTNTLVVTYADVQRDHLSNYPKWTVSLATSPDRPQ